MVLLPNEPRLFEGGGVRVKNYATKEKKYYAALSYRSVVIIHPRAHRRRRDAQAQAERIVENLRKMEAKNVKVQTENI